MMVIHIVNSVKKAFFDDDTLWLHKYHEHEHCKVCFKAHDEYIFFANYKTLSNHYKNKHFQCNDPLCLASKHVVFESAFDLRQHNVSYYY